MNMKHYAMGLTALELSFISLISLCALLMPTWMLQNGWLIAGVGVSTFFLSSFHRIESDALARADRLSDNGRLSRCQRCENPVQPGDTLCFHCKLEASFMAYR